MAALASAAVPGMKPVSVAGMTSDDPDDAPEVQRALVEDATGRRWVVHAPLNPVAGARMQRNDELARQLARHVPFKVPTPAGFAALGHDGSAAVYPFIEGAPLDLARLPAGPGLASAVGRAVAAVHNIPRGVFEEQDVPVFDAAGCRQRATAEVDRASETGRVPTGLLARWEEAFDAAPLWQFATTPVHGTFSGDTVLVTFTDETDAGSGRVVAVLDWREAMVADPAVDLASLYAQASPQAWESVLDSYALARAHRPDPYLHARARLVAETRTLAGLASAVADDREHDVRKIVEALRRMDRLTEDDDSLVPVTARPRAGAPSPPVAPAQPGDTVSTAPAGEASAVAATDDGDDTHALSTPPPVDENGTGGEGGRDEATEAALSSAPERAADPEQVMAVMPAAEPDRGEAGIGSRPESRTVEEPETSADDLTIEVPRVLRTSEPTAAEAPADAPGDTASVSAHLDEDDVPTAAADEAPVPGPGSAPPDGGADDLDAAERLHELYGMPESNLDASTGRRREHDDT
jgi:aminoglycoside phosphotransferase (APT) family kinase protein